MNKLRIKKAPATRSIAMQFSLLLTFIIIWLSINIIFLINASVRERQREELESAAKILVSTLQQKNEPDLLQSVDLPYYILFTLYDSTNDETLATNDPFLPHLPISNGKARRYTQANFFSDGDLNILYYATICSVNNNTEDKKNEYIIQTALNMDTDTASRLLLDLPKIILITIAPLLIISYLAARFISKRILKKVDTITKVAKAISSTNLDMRLPVSNNNDEFDSLTKTFNSLLSRLQKDFEREKQFTQDVSHELKTPIAVILGHAKLIKRWGKNDKEQLEKSLASLINEAHSMESIVLNLLKISRLENGVVSINKTKISLKNFFARLIGDTKAWAEKVDFTILKDLEDSNNTHIFADEELFYEVCTIIISNSIKFAGENAHITLSCKNMTQEKISKIEISDNGPGFSEDSLSYVFERFYRADESHHRNNADSSNKTKTNDTMQNSAKFYTQSESGSGLGLSIVKTIIELHGGTVKAENTSEHGAKISMTIPHFDAQT